MKHFQDDFIDNGDDYEGIISNHLHNSFNEFDNREEISLASHFRKNYEEFDNPNDDSDSTIKHFKDW